MVITSNIKEVLEQLMSVVSSNPDLEFTISKDGYKITWRTMIEFEVKTVDDVVEILSAITSLEKFGVTIY